MLTPHWICFCDFNSYFPSFCYYGNDNILGRMACPGNSLPPQPTPPSPHTFHLTLGHRVTLFSSLRDNHTHTPDPWASDFGSTER